MRERLLKTKSRKRDIKGERRGKEAADKRGVKKREDLGIIVEKRRRLRAGT